jgi:hypothetical protein
MLRVVHKLISLMICLSLEQARVVKKLLDEPTDMPYNKWQVRKVFRVAMV